MPARGAAGQRCRWPLSDSRNPDGPRSLNAGLCSNQRKKKLCPDANGNAPVAAPRNQGEAVAKETKRRWEMGAKALKAYKVKVEVGE
jgi:hypothetical protein